MEKKKKKHRYPAFSSATSTSSLHYGSKEVQGYYEAQAGSV